jgi:hypothetical protein
LKRGAIEFVAADAAVAVDVKQCEKFFLAAGIVSKAKRSSESVADSTGGHVGSSVAEAVKPEQKQKYEVVAKIWDCCQWWSMNPVKTHTMWRKWWSRRWKPLFTRSQARSYSAPVTPAVTVLGIEVGYPALELQNGFVAPLSLPGSACKTWAPVTVAAGAAAFGRGEQLVAFRYAWSRWSLFEIRSFTTKSTIDESAGGFEAAHSDAMNWNSGINDLFANEFVAGSEEERAGAGMYAVEDESEILPGKAADGAALAGGRGGADAPQPMRD